MNIGIFAGNVRLLSASQHYMLSIAEFFSGRNWDTQLFWHDQTIIREAAELFSLNLDTVRCNGHLYSESLEESSYAAKLARLISFGKFDMLIWLVEGKIPYLRAKHNWLCVHQAFPTQDHLFTHQQNLSHIERVICNSVFTKKQIDLDWHISSEVLYPPVVIFIPSNEKTSLILSVGSFDSVHQKKRQDMLISSFKELVDSGVYGWQLVLAGTHTQEDTDLLGLRQAALGYPIDFRVNISREEITMLYNQASIYWQATGFHEDSSELIEVESFGTSLVEAMSASCVPVAYQAGSVSEIIRNKINGYIFHTTEQLVHMTHQIIQDYPKTASLRQAARNRSLSFRKEFFTTSLEKRIEGLEL